MRREATTPGGARVATPASPHRVTGRAVRTPAAGRVATVMRLQSGAGNRATASLLARTAPVVQRAGPPVATPVAAAPKTQAEIEALDLRGFNAHANAQADWARQAALLPADRTKLVGVLEFARSGSPAPLPGLGDLNVKDVADSNLTPTVRTQLRTFARGVAATDTAGFDRTSVLADALRDGEALGKLEAAIPKALLHLVMGTNDPGKAQFRALVTAGEVDAFATYYRRGRPALEDPDGADVRSYLAMVGTDGKNPVSYVGVLPHVRNYHRFLAPMLDTLVTNEADVTRARPLLIILHSGSDHNGAFARDLGLMATVQHRRNLTIMIEGATTLEAAGAEVGRVARRQGQGGKIGQVMLAGHGNTRSIQLAGSQRPDGTFRSDSIDLDTNRARSERFLRGLVARMAPGPDAHILLNACLTAADGVEANLPADPARAKAMILRSLRTSPSLAGRIGQMAPGIGVEGNVSSVSAGEYMATDHAGNPTGTLHGTVAGDPFATTSNRGDYIEHGTEAEGCIRAAVALWAVDRAECLRRVGARVGRPIAGWDDRVVHMVFDLLLAAPDNIAFINRIATSGATGLSELDHVSEQKPESVGGLVNVLSRAELGQVFGPLYPHLPSTGQIAIEAAWMVKDHSHRAPFMALLDTFPTAFAVQNHLSVDWLAPSMTALLPRASAAAPTSAQAKLALYGATGGRRNAAAVAFLRAGATGSGRIAVPVGTTVDGLSGADDEDAVLVTVGLRGGAAAVAPASPTANFDTDGDGTNDAHVESVTRHGAVTAFGVRLRRGPAMGAPLPGNVPAGEVLYVFGRSGAWLAVDRPGGGTGFVHRSWVREVRVT